jgi:hydroxymethylglutaryl-CoA lyase
MSTQIEIRDVSPRDGLQDHAPFVPTTTKAELIRRLAAVGVRSIEVTSFVSPKVVPQLSDAADLCEQLPSELRNAVRVSAFVGTASWLDRALSCGLDEVSIAVPATDAMSQANFRRDTATMLTEAALMRDHAPGVEMSATIAVAFGCPYEGSVSLDRVLSLADSLADAGFERILLGDTIGVGNPAQVTEVVTALTQRFPELTIGGHFHDSRGAAVANVVAAVAAGARVIDAALAGIGGCPFAPGAAGNVALEDVVWVLEGMGMTTGIDRVGVTNAARWLADTLEVPLASKTPRHRLFDWERLPEAVQP